MQRDAPFELPARDQARFVISDIQQKSDASFVIVCNGFPFHATELDTPDVYQQVLGMLEDGAPCTGYIEPVASDVDIAAQERAWRDAEINRIKWLRERHRDEQEMGGVLTLSGEEFGELLHYLQALRDWPQSTVFPDAGQRPTPPASIIAFTS